ncbi:MAG: VWA domain-containing protein, partial [Acidobacteriota bacterium]
MHRFLIPVFALLLAAVPSIGQSPPADSGLTEDGLPDDGLPIAIESAHVHVVNVEVYVTDRDGKAVTGLEREDFVLEEDERAVEITNFFAVERGRPAESMPVLEQPTVDPDAEFPELPERQARLPEAQRLHLILYFDNLFLEPFSRGKVIREARRFLANHVLPGDKVMVVTFERSLHVRQAFTEDLALIHAALTDIEDMSGLAVQGNAERDRVLRLVDEADTYSEAEQFADFYAKQVDDDRRRSVRALEDLITPMAGLDGRKALLYVSDGIPMTAAADLFELISLRYGKQGATGFQANRYNARREFRRLIRSANANRVTFYTIDAKGLRSHASLSAEFRSSAEGGS